jgi:hypothetical protein
LSLERRHPWLLPVRIWQSVPDVGEEAIEQVVLVGLEEPVCRPVMTLMMSPADVHYGNARRLTDTGDGARIAPETRGCRIDERVDTSPSQRFGFLHAGLFVVQLVTD